MATHATPTSRKSDARLLRRTLQGNGIFSSISGVICIVGAGPITSFLGLSSSVILVIIGIVLLLYAVSLFLTTARQPIDLRSGLLYAIIDSAWVVGSVILLLTNWIPFTTEGRWSVGLVAVIVALFAELQFYGVWRAR